MIAIRQVRPDKAVDGLQSGQTDDGWQAALIALACHANTEKTGSCVFDVDGMDDGPHILELKCQSGACRSTMPQKATYHVTKEQMAVAALHFHSWHEGHGMSITLDGVPIHPKEAS